MKKIEILAPAGSYDSMVAAMNGGCDAVYVGGSQFGARAYANNFDEDELCRAIDFAHLRGKQIYLTVNTLLKDQEIKNDLYKYLLKPYEYGLDAVIVQDVGVLHFIHKNFPKLPIHASTQMTLTMSKGADIFNQYGVTRLVTSRELSLAEINEISKSTNLEIESFVHGALCYCYSGQCLMSSMLGGRSGNRGRCAGTCRMPYELIKDGKSLSNPKESYLLSPKDICTLDIIPDLVDAGIDSFKIEGRMKRAEYTAYVSYLYRSYVDRYLDLGREQYEDYIRKNQKQFDLDVQNLMELYNRGNFTNGYYKAYNGKNMMSMSRPNHNGIQVGEIVSTKSDKATIMLSKDIQSQDVLEFRGKKGAVYDYTVKDPAKRGTIVQANYLHDLDFSQGDLVYRTKNQQLLDCISTTYCNHNHKISMRGYFEAQLDQPISLNLKAKDCEITVFGEPTQKAQKQPITKEKIAGQLSKTNTTLFEFEDLVIEVENDVFMPIGWINDLRRNGIEALTTKILEGYHRPSPDIRKNNRSLSQIKTLELGDENEPTSLQNCIRVAVSNEVQLLTAMKYSEIDAIYIRMDDFLLSEALKLVQTVVAGGKKAYLIMPHIFRKDRYDLFTKELESDIQNRIQDVTGYVIKAYEEYEWLVHHNLNDHNVILDYNMYTINQEAKEFWMEKGVRHFTTSVELNYQEMKALKISDSDLIVYGYIPLMVTAGCLLKNNTSCTKEEGIYQLKDRYNKRFIVMNHCKNCYNTIYNESPISLLSQSKEVNSLHAKTLRLDFTIETEQEVETIMKAYIDVFGYNKAVQFYLNHHTKGHFKRGIE